MVRLHTYHQLDAGDRHYIEIEYNRGRSMRSIARALGCSHTTVSREVKRGLYRRITPDGSSPAYSAAKAQAQHAESMARRGAKRRYDADTVVVRALCRLLKGHYSPYAARTIIGMRTVSAVPSVNTIYRYIRCGAIPVGEDDLLRGFLDSRRRRPESVPFNRRKSVHHDGGKSIERRPKVVLRRKMFGDWEGDLICGSKGTHQALLTLVERKTRFCIAIKIRDKSAASVVSAFDLMEAQFGAAAMERMFRSITFDNGSEFADADAIKAGGRVGEIYYAHPHYPGERGSNENCNGMIRRFAPKGTDFEDLSDSRVADIMDFINTYPRLILGGRSAQDLFRDEAGWIFHAA